MAARTTTRRYSVQEMQTARDNPRLCNVWQSEVRFSKSQMQGLPSISPLPVPDGMGGNDPLGHMAAIKLFFRNHGINFDGVFRYSARKGNWKGFDYLPAQGLLQQRPEGDWRQATHGLTPYSLASSVAGGALVPSYDEDLGHGMLCDKNGTAVSGNYLAPDFKKLAQGMHCLTRCSMLGPTIASA